MRILIGLSGGLDSTYAAFLLKEQGHEVSAVFLRMHEFMDPAEAEESARSLGIPLEVVDCQAEFEQAVISDFIYEYSQGRTPNPCVVCNRYVKIEKLCEYARANGFDRVATGHYGYVKNEGGRYYVTAAEDISRDQSYMLWQLSQEQLAMLATPLSGMKKTDIRERAKAAGLAACDRKESREICFIPDNDYAGYIERRVGKSESGDFIDENGNVVGRHRGIIHYTVGQRKHLGIALGKPIFITKIDAVSNTVTVAPAGSEFGGRITVSGLNFQKIAPTEQVELDLFVKVRYAAVPAAAHVVIEGGVASVTFKEPARALTPGQSAVFYDGSDVVFGGFIKSV